jgi:tRNA A37 threonylcarbamoyladenosine biosynthesis protein TsaE
MANLPDLKPATPCVVWAVVEWDWAWADEAAAEDLAVEVTHREDQAEEAVMRRKDQEGSGRVG